MSHFPPPAADDVIYREDGAGRRGTRGRRGLPRWVPVAAAAGVVALLAVVGLVAFGGDDDEGSGSPWRLLRAEVAGGQWSTVVVDGATATYEPLAVVAEGMARNDPASTLLALVDDATGVVAVVDSVSGDVRTITVEPGMPLGRRFGDLLLATDGSGGHLVDLRAGTAVDLHVAFGIPADVRLFDAQPGRDGAVLVFGDGGAGMIPAGPGAPQWFDGALYDVAGTRAVAGTVGEQRVLTLYDAGVAVGTPVTVEGRVRVRLQRDANTAVVVEESGRILRVNFDSGEATEAARIPAELLAEAGQFPTMHFVADDRFLMEVGADWALLGTDGALVARFSPGQLEPGASEASLRGVGTTCMVLVVGGDVPDRTVVVEIAGGEVRLAVAGGFFDQPSPSGCSLLTGGNAYVLVVEGAAVPVPGDVVAHSPDFSQVVVRAAGGTADSAAVTLYTVRDGALVEPVTLEPGRASYQFVTTAAPEE